MPPMYQPAMPGYYPMYPGAAMNPYMYNPLQNYVYGYNPYDMESAQAMMQN